MRPKDSTLASSAIYIREPDPRVIENYDVNVEKSRVRNINFLVTWYNTNNNNNNNNEIINELIKLFARRRAWTLVENSFTLFLKT